jgi:hypothetical protein
MGPTAEHDWYAYLRLSPDAPADEIERAVERLSRQASALAATAPERSHQLRETVRAMKRDLLSGPEARHRYDERVRQAGDGAAARLARFLRTGWTCPSCGKGGVPSDKFCTKCGTPIRPTQDSAAGPDRAPRQRLVCQDCANPLAPSDVFCSKCGTRR